MDSMTAVSVKNISKKYRLFGSVKERFLEALHPFQKEYHREFWALEPKNTYTPTTLEKVPSKIYDVMGLTYLFSHRPLWHPTLRLAYKGDRYGIYHNLNAVPRFYFSRGIETKKGEEIKRLIPGATWGPKDVTLVETAIPPTWLLGRRVSRGSRISVLQESHNRIVLRTRSSSSEYLATTESFHSDWRVYVDGIEKPVVKTNYYFRGVFLEPGEHEIEFKYVSRGFQTGMILTLLCLLLFFLILFEERYHFLKRKSV